MSPAFSSFRSVNLLPTRNLELLRCAMSHVGVTCFISKMKLFLEKFTERTLGLCTAVTCLRGVPFGDFWAVNLPKRLKTVKIYNKLIKRSQTDIKHQEKFKTVLKRTIGNEIDRGSKISRAKSQIWLGVSGSRLNFTVSPVDLYWTYCMFNRKKRYFTATFTGRSRRMNFCRKMSHFWAVWQLGRKYSKLPKVPETAFWLPTKRALFSRLVYKGPVSGRSLRF